MDFSPEPRSADNHDGTVDTRLFVDLLEGLNDEQTQAVSSLSGPLMVIAGPGSGKTRVLTHRIAALLRTGVAPYQVLAVTFTNKAAAEMRERLSGIVGDVSGMWVTTFHSACVRILRANADRVGLRSSFGIADADDAQRILRRLLEADGVTEPAALARELAGEISLAKNNLKRPDQLGGSARAAQVAGYYRRYQQALRDQQLVDFDDLLMLTVDLFDQHPDVLDGYRQRWRHIMVDEYQDTNACQYRLLRQLGDHGNVCVVGDHDQGVYSWRGASPEALASFVADWPSTTVVVLNRNYRSTGRILQVAQAVIDPNPAAHRAQLWTSNDDGPPVRLYVAVDDRDEARSAVDEIVASTLLRREHAVIYRTNAQSRVFEQELRSRGVPYQVVSGTSFYDHAEVRDAMSYLKLVSNPSDRESFRRAVAVPRRGVGDAALGALFDVCDAHGVDPVAALTMAGGRATKSFVTVAEHFSGVVAAADDGPAAALDAVLAIGGFVEAAVRRGDGRDEMRRENLRELVASAKEFEERGGTDGDISTFAFVESVSLLADFREADDVDAVQLLTAHAAKGREYDAVFVVGVEDGFFPHINASGVDGAAEERRLLFVAVSRARRKLRISRSTTRFMFRDRVPRDPSPFLRDVHGVVEEVHSTAWVPSPQRQPWRQGSPAITRTSMARHDPLNVVRPVSAAATGPRLGRTDLQAGMAVSHGVYGAGTVESFDDEIVRVRFAGKLRVLLLAHAPLTAVA
jgi:DNA helicase II / ATP-dependent DNA helicase PcrA